MAGRFECSAIGWDNTVWVTGGGVAFRFPRREIAVAGVEREIEFLPRLAPHLPVAIPDAAYPGTPGPLFPWPWFGSRVVSGRELAEARLDDEARVCLATDLGAFLRCLHGLSLPGLDSLPVDPMGRADTVQRVSRTRAALDRVDPSGAFTDRAGATLAAAESLPPAEDSVLAHGDLHIRHALVDASGRLTGVIDWGDVCRGPAAIDLSLYWSLFPPVGREVFLDSYGAVSEAALLRARLLALFLNATLAVYARDQRMAALEAEALSGIERTFAE